MCISVNLPDPDGPVTARNSPRGTSIDTARSALTSTYFLLVRGASGLASQSPYMLSVESDSSFHVNQISPPAAGNFGPVTLSITTESSVSPSE